MGASEENDVEKVAAGFEHEADELQRRSDELGEDIDTTRQDWKQKRNDASVPGAVPEPEHSDQDAGPADEDAGPADQDAGPADEDADA